MEKLFKFKHFEVIKKEIGNIEQNKYSHFFTKGKWSSHELLLYLLFFSGKNSKVKISSFSLSDINVRMFHKAIDANYINHLELILNQSVKRHKIDLLMFAYKTVSKIGLTNMHAKITLIESDNIKIVINQSANSTINTAHEAGVICTYPEIYNKYYNYFSNTMNNSILFENDFKK